MYDWIIISFWNSRCARQPCWIFQYLTIVPYISAHCWVSITISNLLLKFWSTPKLWPKNEIQNGDRRHLEFDSGGYFNSLPTLHYRCQPPYKISCKYLNPRLKYNNFLQFKMVPVRHVGFSNTILYFRKPDFWAMDCLALPIFHHRTKFGAKMLIGARIMAQNRNSRWRKSAILDFRKSDQWPISCLWLLIHHSTKFGTKWWSTPKLLPKFEIQDGGRPPYWNCCSII